MRTMDEKTTQPIVESPKTGVVDVQSQARDGLPLVACPNYTTERALVRRVDYRLVPVLCVLYLMAFLDRVNISNALTLGLPKELHLIGNEVNTALAIFFVPYIVFEIPSNMLLKRFKPHVWLSACMLLFGFIMTMQGFVHNYSGLLATRFFLGLAEAGVFPGCFYLLSMWYKRDEAQRRFSLFFGSATLAGAFGSLLASGIENMDGVRGYSGWRWIFILEGIATCLLSIAAYFVILDFPESSKWLTVEEKAFMSARLRGGQRYSSIVNRKTTSEKFMAFFMDIKTICGGLMYFGITIPAYGLAYFTPTIVKGYGYSAIQTQLHSTPPSAIAWALAVTLAFFSDKIRLRSLPLAIALAIAVAGSAILLAVQKNTKLEYGALFLLASGTYSAMPIIICWYTMNLASTWERSVGTGWQIGFGNIGAIVATFSFTAADAPYYHKGYSIVMGALCLVIATSVLYFVVVLRENGGKGGNTENVSGDENCVLGGGPKEKKLYL